MTPEAPEAPESRGLGRSPASPRFGTRVQLRVHSRHDRARVSSDGPFGDVTAAPRVTVIV
jgi:hypothetical protein